MSVLGPIYKCAQLIIPVLPGRFGQGAAPANGSHAPINQTRRAKKCSPGNTQANPGLILRGCVKYREAHDRELPNAQRTDSEFEEHSNGK